MKREQENLWYRVPGGSSWVRSLAGWGVTGAQGWGKAPFRGSHLYRKAGFPLSSGVDVESAGHNQFTPP